MKGKPTHCASTMPLRARLVTLACLAIGGRGFARARRLGRERGRRRPSFPGQPPRCRSAAVPLGVGVAQGTKTIYVVNQDDNTVSVIDGATCNAIHTRVAARPRRRSPSATAPSASPSTRLPTRSTSPTLATTPSR